MPRVNWDTFIQSACSGAKVVSFPTDTVPALACHPKHAQLLFDIKQRSSQKSLILMAASAADLWPYVVGSSAERSYWQDISQTVWPGATTLVLPASPQVPTCMNPQTPQYIGLRVPKSSIAQEILRATGPLATTSANYSGQPALQTLQDISAQFPEVITLEAQLLSSPWQDLNPNEFWSTPLGSGQPSTVLQWKDQSWHILRQGSTTTSLPQFQTQ